MKIETQNENKILITVHKRTSKIETKICSPLKILSKAQTRLKETTTHTLKRTSIKGLI